MNERRLLALIARAVTASCINGHQGSWTCGAAHCSRCVAQLEVLGWSIRYGHFHDALALVDPSDVI